MIVLCVKMYKMYKMYKNLNLFDVAVIAGAVVIGCFLYARKREREKKLLFITNLRKKKHYY